MNVILAKNSGFCFGVKRAVQAVEENAGKRIVTLGQLIHNDSVMRSLESRGVRCVSSIDEVEPGETVIIRSHGAPPDVYERLAAGGFDYIDLTCPHVKRIHDRVREARREGIPVIIVGEKGHPEVDGIIGWAQEGAICVNSEEEAALLPRLEKAVAVAQTTLTEEKWAGVIKTLEGRVNELIPFCSICSATKERQDEAKEIAQRADAVVVVGGKHSSNTQKLYELCKKYCGKVYYIEHYKELSLEIMRTSDIIGIVAGASTPDTIIREVFDCMTEEEKVLHAGGDGPADTAADMAEEAAAADSAAEVAATSEEQQRENATSEDIGQEETEPEQENYETKDTDDINPEDAGETVTGEEQAEPETLKTQHSNEDPKPPTEADVFLEGLEKVVNLKKGQIIKGTIVQITDDDVCVNIGYKSDGIIQKNELSLADVNPRDLFKVGDEIEAEVINLNDGDGNVLLSRRRIEKKLNWKRMKENVGSENIYKCVVRKAVKGGVTTKIEGYSAFIPASHIALKYVEDLKQFEGKEIEVTLIDADKKQERLVASHKNVLLIEKREKEEKLWNSFSKGDIVKGTVKRLADFGAFVDIGGIDGLLHVSDICWHRIKHPSEVVSEGQELELIVLNVDPSKKKIALGYKQIQPKPWDNISERYRAGDKVTGKVVRIVPFGAFVQLEPNIDGLIHISQVSKRRLDRVEDELKVGDTVEAMVLEVIPEKKKISLSRKALIPEEPRPEKKEKPLEEENYKYEIPPVQESKVSLADFFPKKDE